MEGAKVNWFIIRKPRKTRFLGFSLTAKLKRMDKVQKLKEVFRDVLIFIIQEESEKTG